MIANWRLLLGALVVASLVVVAAAAADQEDNQEDDCGDTTTRRPRRRPRHRGPKTTSTQRPVLTCASVLCVRGSQCRMVDGRPVCECASICPDVFRPVCGTDGKTYGNECELEVAACKQNSGIQVAHEGECASELPAEEEEPQEQDPCSIVRCGWGAQCRVNREGRAVCECPSICTAIYMPVCGTDGKTYGNECELRAAACRAQSDLRSAGQGKCGGASGDEQQEQQQQQDLPERQPQVQRDPCAIVRCGWGAQCRVTREGRAQCQCVRERCPNNIQGVCGSDGKTYGTECDMKFEACERKTSIEVVHQGDCGRGNKSE